MNKFILSGEQQPNFLSKIASSLNICFNCVQVLSTLSPFGRVVPYYIYSLLAVNQITKVNIYQIFTVK